MDDTVVSVMPQCLVFSGAKTQHLMILIILFYSNKTGVSAAPTTPTSRFMGRGIIATLLVRETHRPTVVSILTPFVRENRKNRY